MKQITVDARGMACPFPVINTKKAVEELTQGGSTTVIVDNEIASQNIMKYAKQKALEAICTRVSQEEYQIVIQVPLKVAGVEQDAAARNAASESSYGTQENDHKEQPEMYSCEQQKQTYTVAVLASNQMGSGDEKLGKTLMKAFIFALTRQDTLPDTILLYHAGAFLSCEGSESLEDLRAMEAEGVQIQTCGTCLDYYGIKDQLAVGTVTNMYDIVTELMKADCTLRP